MREYQGWLGNGHPSPDFIREQRPDYCRPSWQQYDIWLTDEQIHLIERALQQYQSPADSYSMDEAIRFGLRIAFGEGMGSNYTVEWQEARGLRERLGEHD